MSEKRIPTVPAKLKDMLHEACNGNSHAAGRPRTRIANV